MIDYISLKYVMVCFTSLDMRTSSHFLLWFFGWRIFALVETRSATPMRFFIKYSHPL
jgi:hypothetical protein